jgi:hypothetical protein
VVLRFLLALRLVVAPGLVVVPEWLLVVPGFLLALRSVLMSGGGGSRLTPSGIGGTHLGTARRARRRCRWLMAARG